MTDTDNEKGNTSKSEEDYVTPAHQWTVDFLYKEFRNESDRASVILVASLMDEALTSLLKNYFVTVPHSSDPLFDSSTAPLSTFSSKIDIAHRTGLLSNKLSRDIHLIRKIRNSFAHDIYGCSFDNGSVKSRVDELYKSAVELTDRATSSPREKFLYISAAILWCINHKILGIKMLDNPPLEWLYAHQKNNK